MTHNGSGVRIAAVGQPRSISLGYIDSVSASCPEWHSVRFADGNLLGAEMKSRLIGALAVATCVTGLAVAPASASAVTYDISFYF